MRRALLGGALLFGVVSCGDEGASLEDFFAAGQTIVCDFQVECGFFPDIETCESLSGVDVEAAEARNAVDNGRMLFDNAEARACLAALREQLTCNIGEFGRSETPERCNDVTAGLVELGGTCFSDDECAGEAECDGDGDSGTCSSGTCVEAEPEPERVGEGGDCRNTLCEDELFCLREGVEATCTARAAEGEACQGLGSCVDGFACDEPFGPGLGRCVDPAATGEQCDQGLGVVACELPTDICDPVASVCVRRPGEGESCNPNNDRCLDYAFCTTAAVCQVRPLEGEACSDEPGAPRCLGSLDCESGRCVLDVQPACLP